MPGGEAEVTVGSPLHLLSPRPVSAIDKKRWGSGIAGLLCLCQSWTAFLKLPFQTCPLGKNYFFGEAFLSSPSSSCSCPIFL